MDFNREYFKGKTAVVTGAASGIGLALVEELLDSDATKVVMADINPDNLSKHEKRLQEQYPGHVKGIICDVTKEESVNDLIKQSAEFFDGSFDLLFNNAGAGLSGAFSDCEISDWKMGFDLNFYGALYGMRAVIPIMLKQGGGQIINIISGIAFTPMAFQSRYAATKAALNGLSLALRAEYWDENIKVSSATPGTTATAIFKADGGEAPDTAQSPQQSVSRILDGVANNVRLIFGDDSDADGGKHSFHIDAQTDYDEYLLNVTRARRKGETAF